MNINININTTIVTEVETIPVLHAIEDLKRDLKKCCLNTQTQGHPIYLEKSPMASGCFRVNIHTPRLETAGVNEVVSLRIQASDNLGFIYGIYHISRNILGVSDFWFWYDQEPTKQESYSVEEGYSYQSKPFAVKLRGWFVNDEVLLQKWHLEGDKDKPWEMVFETLLRCGGNLIIPGTDKNSTNYRQIASDRGLYITHHHAEPLGAEMFSRAFPDLEASYDTNPDKFQQLWKEGIEKQKDLNIVWNIGFRGQGDCPFWDNDPRYDTSESRGKLMSELIEMQYHLIKEADGEALCCTNLYGETMELYKDGYLELPDDVIKIWADNGFGKMVTRRQNNHNPRIIALPGENNIGSHGIYYHVSFYDLQAANHMTMLANSPEFVIDELKDVLDRGMDDYWIINCSNIKPHVYYLDLIAKVWQQGDVDVKAHRDVFTKTYYGEKYKEEVSNCLEAYHRYAVAFGNHKDEHAGEQFANHVARMLISQCMRDSQHRSEQLLWATKADDFESQIVWYQEICNRAAEGYTNYLKLCELAVAKMDGSAKVLFEDTILLQAKMLERCYRGAYEVTRSLRLTIEGDYKHAFYYAGKAEELYREADKSMRAREHGKWYLFYENECLTDIKQTATVLKGLMSYIRNMGEGPHFYDWHREFLYSDYDRKVMLILNMENHLTDQELYEQMKRKWDV